MEKIDKDKFYSPQEVADLGVNEILSSREKVLFLCEERNTDKPILSFRKGRRITIKGQWILDFIIKNNL